MFIFNKLDIKWQRHVSSLIRSALIMHSALLIRPEIRVYCERYVVQCYTLTAYQVLGGRLTCHPGIRGTVIEIFRCQPVVNIV